MPFPSRPALIAALSLAMGCAAPLTAQTADTPIKVDVGNSRGICSVTIPAGENGLKLEFSIKASNLNVNAVLHNIPGEVVDAGLNAGKQPRITLMFDGNRRHELDWGAYNAGFTYRVAGGWDDPNLAADMLEDLKASSTVTFIADGRNWGPISLQAKGLLYTYLENCIVQNQQQGGN